MTNSVYVDLVTDPFCSWCWGSEPELRALELLFGEQVQVQLRMGYLVVDVRDEPFYEVATLGYEGANQKLAAHWPTPTKKTGMPTVGDNFSMFSEEHFSGLPVARAYYAVKLAYDEVTAGRYLRRLREGIFTEGERVIVPEVQLKIASSLNLDPDSIRKYLENGEAEAAFQEDIEWADSKWVEVYPTYFFRVGKEERRLAGYIRFPEMVETISELTQGEIRPQYFDKTSEALAKVLEETKKLAVTEVRLLFKFDSQEAALDWLKKQDNETFRLTPVGESFWIELR